MRHNRNELAILLGLAALGAFIVTLASIPPVRRRLGDVTEKARRRLRDSTADEAIHSRDVPEAPGERGMSDVRPAGPQNLRDPARRWDKVDEAGVESFPASDPPAIS